MPQPRASQAIKDMLVERNIALWQAHHYTNHLSKNPGRPTAKDPVTVCLMTPSIPDRMFYGHGATCDEAVMNALSMPFNTALRVGVGGVLGEMARLEGAIMALEESMLKERWNTFRDDLDDDIPF